MRAKYYGVKYIINRPALRYLLATRSGATSGSTSTPGSRPSESPVGPGHRSQFPSPAIAHNQAGGAKLRRQSEMAPPSGSAEPSALKKDDLVLLAEECIKAAFRSTTVFDDVPERIIITNVFGTAHA